MNLVISVILGVAAIVCFIISIRQFNNKGYLLNNQYIFANEEQRRTMDKKPYYKQSGIVFLMISIVELLDAIGIYLEVYMLTNVSIAVVVVTLIYASVSTVAIEKKQKNKKD
ncbi:MAG: DUF3784 domain-containing protein [Lachnospiraceae bacterium]|nr:DUF3784 domain-containing protein [Lachnospiraceae bacterium]